MNIREPAVAGMFYPAKKENLEKKMLELFKGTAFFPQEKPCKTKGFARPRKSFAFEWNLGKKGFSSGKEFTTNSKEKTKIIIAPHAGYEYSGRTAAIAFSALEKAKTFIILGPNHTGIGASIAIPEADAWQTPFGEIKIDFALREKLLAKLGIEADDSAHLQEHSTEVQLPFLQFLFQKTDFKILPICIATANFAKLVELGNALAEACSEETAIIASSDFTHFEPLESAKEKDLEAIKLIEELDAREFYNIVMQKQISICGFAPIITAMQYAKARGYKKAILLKYDSSATASHDKASVVGYAAIKFCK